MTAPKSAAELAKELADVNGHMDVHPAMVYAFLQGHAAGRESAGELQTLCEKFISADDWDEYQHDLAAWKASAK